MLTYKGYRIKKEKVLDLEKHKKALTLKPFVIPDYDFNVKPFPVYRQTEEYLYVPKFYGLEHFGPPKKSREREGDDINIKFKGKLRDYQQEIVGNMISHLNEKDGGILSCGCGRGKTIMALNIISKIKKKTLVVVHKEFLMDQWKDRIKQFLPNARVGTIRQNKVDVENKDIVIAMLQSLSLRGYPKEIFDSVGLVTLDECFPYKQLIVTEDGPQKIGYIYNLWKQNKELPRVLSYNKTSDSLEYKDITYAWKKVNNKLLKINYGSGDIECTPNHRILTPNGYVEAEKLYVGDLIKCTYKDSNTVCDSNRVTNDFSLQEIKTNESLWGEYLDYYDLKKVKVCTVKIKSIEEIQNEGRSYNGNVYDIEVKDNHNFVLCTGLQNNYGPIVHNCHRVCSKAFSKALFSAYSKKVLGLSATPQRKDGLTCILNWFMGDIITPEFESTNLDPFVKLIEAEYENPPRVRYNAMGKMNIPQFITEISQDPERNKIIIKEIKRCIKEGRKILVLSERRKQCEDLHKIFPTNSGLYLGGMKKEVLEESNKQRIIFATYSMVHEGYDCGDLCTLIMATGRSDIEQATGRILRKKNKNRPLIIDIHDPALNNQKNKRKRYYRKKKYEIIEANCTDVELDSYAFIDD